MVNALDFGLILLVLASVAFGVLRKARRVALGLPEDRCGEARRRLGAVWRAVVGQERLLRERRILRVS